MSDTTGMSGEQRDELLEEYLRHVHGVGSEPDLSGLSEAEAEDVRSSFAMVDALWGSRPASPPIERDPVAARLGLTDAGPAGDLLAGQEQLEPVGQAVQGLTHRYPRLVEVESAAATAGTVETLRPLFVCRSLAERVSVIEFAPGSTALPGTREALDVFHADVDITAVAFTSSDAQAARILTFPDCHRRLDPDAGWKDVADALAWEPLDIALGRYFEQSIMHWDDVGGLDPSGALDDLTNDIATVAHVRQRVVTASRPRLDHKRDARDYLAAVPAEVFVGWLSDVYAAGLTGEELADRISEYVRTEAS